jgi:hypothetical protein
VSAADSREKKMPTTQQLMIAAECHPYRNALSIQLVLQARDLTGLGAHSGSRTLALKSLEVCEAQRRMREVQS